MVESKRNRHLSDIAKNVLQDPDRTAEQTAWELLYAIADLFPERLAELRALGARLVSEYENEREEDDEDNRNAEERFRLAVGDWTSRNRIACPAVEEAAEKYAVGDTASAR